MATPKAMPAPGHSTVPSFLSSDPQELDCFFDELEFLFTACNVTNDGDKKRHATRYVNFNTSEQWRSLEQYKAHIDVVPAAVPPAPAGPAVAVPQTYDMYKAAVIRLYPGASTENRYSIEDLNRLIQNPWNQQIKSIGDFAHYYRQFFQISWWLTKNDQLGTLERDRLFKNGLGAGIWPQLQSRLNISHPTIRPGEPYTIQQIKEAAEFNGRLDPAKHLYRAIWKAGEEM
ncbi:hypothetical protein DXG01_014859 [Tephrocybe rancida]|nr:hypothetical protein DXG01_014859 [Tephrocybe rancida]